MQDILNEEMDDEAFDSMASWVELEGGVFFWRELAARIEQHKKNAITPYDRNLSVDKVNAIRADEASKAWALDGVLGLVEDIRREARSKESE